MGELYHSMFGQAPVTEDYFHWAPGGIYCYQVPDNRKAQLFGHGGMKENWGYKTGGAQAGRCNAGPWKKYAGGAPNNMKIGMDASKFAGKAPPGKWHVGIWKAK